MERDLSRHHNRPRPSCLSGCMMSSPSCFPVHDEMEYSRIESFNYCNNNNIAGAAANKGSRRWRNLLRRLVREGRTSIYGSKPLSFRYDAVSYSQNFDDGNCHCDESRRVRYPQVVFRDVRWDLRDDHH